MPETQKTVAAWARETFPGGDDLSPRHCLRALEEMVELCMAAGASARDCNGAALDAADSVCRKRIVLWSHPKPDHEAVPEELADVAICLLALAERRGVDLQKEIDRKMEKNRARQWETRPDGTGYHRNLT